MVVVTPPGTPGGEAGTVLFWTHHFHVEISIWWWEELKLLFRSQQCLVLVMLCLFCYLWKDSQAPSPQKGLLSHPGYPLEYKCHRFISVLCQSKHNQLCWNDKNLIYIPGERSPKAAQGWEQRCDLVFSSLRCLFKETSISPAKYQGEKASVCSIFLCWHFDGIKFMVLQRNIAQQSSQPCQEWEILPKPASASRLHVSTTGETRSPLTWKLMFPLHGALLLNVECLLFIIWDRNKPKYQPWHLDLEVNCRCVTSLDTIIWFL